MGFRLNRTYVLKFAGDMEKAEVKIRSTSTATSLALREVSDDTRAMVALLADHVIEWNFEKADGTPLPIETDAIMNELEEVVIAALLTEWYKAATGVTAPLDNGSTNGAPFPVESIPME